MGLAGLAECGLYTAIAGLFLLGKTVNEMNGGFIRAAFGSMML
jgi:hypothetical protein